VFEAQACPKLREIFFQFVAEPTCLGSIEVPATGSPLAGSHVTPLTPSAIPQHQMVLLVAIAQVTPVPGDVMLDHLAGRFGMVLTAALAGAADNKTGRLPAINAMVARNVWAIFLIRMGVLSLFSFC
jgi:hypothetical protein